MTYSLPDFYDLTWTYRRGEPKLKLLTDNGVEYEDFPFRPYFYIKREALDESDRSDEVLQAIAGVDETATLVREEDTYQGKLWKVEVEVPTNVKKCRNQLEKLDIRTFEADIPFSRRVMIDLDQPVSVPDEILSFDMEIHAEEGVPDVEKADKRVLSICGVGSDGQEWTFAWDDEEQTLRDFIDVAQDYGCVIGWNSLKFDFPYLINRSRNLGIDFDPFTLTHVDAFPTYRRILLKRQNSYRLDYIAEQEFDWSYGGDIKYAELHEYFEDNRQKLVEYNLDDARVVDRLNQRYQFKQITFDILASNGYCRPRDIFYVRSDSGYQRVDKASNTLIEGAVIRLSQGDNGPRVVWPNKGSAKSGAFEGAKVFDPTPGLHKNAIVLDFASMYPSIIWALNVGPETFREEGGDIKAPTGTFISEPRSRFAEAYDTMKDERDTYTNMKKELPRGTDDWLVADSLDRGLKTYVNCFAPDTEVLTPDGIKLIGDIDVGDDVYSIDPESQKLEVQPVIDTYESDYTGEMYKISNSNYEQLVTPNHRFLVDEYDGSMRCPDPMFREIQDMEGRHVVPTHSPLGGTTPETVNLGELASEGEVLIEYESHLKTIKATVDVSDLEITTWHREGGGSTYLFRVSAEEYSSNQARYDELIDSDYTGQAWYRYDEKYTKQPLEIDPNAFLKLLGWYISEGGSDGDGCVIYQQTYNDTLVEDLDRTGLHYKKYDDGVQIPGGIGSILSNLCGKKSNDKRIPEFVFDWNGTDLYALFHRLCLGDGRLNDREVPVSYVTSSDELREQIKRLAVQVGTIPKDTARDVRFLNDFQSRHDTIDMDRDVEVVDYDGPIQCITAKDNHTILAGQNGRYGWTGQTFYGVQGSGYSRFYDRRVAEAITLMGQNMLDFSADLAREREYGVVYGDTDSVILELGEDVSDPVKRGKELSKEFTVELKRWIEEEFNGDPERIDLELDEVYDTFFMTDSRKRYAGLCIYDGAACFTYEKKGFESVRGDWPDAPSNFQDECLRAILKQTDPWPIVEKYKNDLYNGKLDQKLVKHVMLRSEIEEYKSMPPHVRVAKRQRQKGNEIRVGDRIAYIKYGNDPKDVQYAGEDGDQIPNLSRNMYDYIWSKYFKSIMDRLGIEKHEKTELTDFVAA